MPIIRLHIKSVRESWAMPLVAAGITIFACAIAPLMSINTAYAAAITAGAVLVALIITAGLHANAVSRWADSGPSPSTETSLRAERSAWLGANIVVAVLHAGTVVMLCLIIPEVGNHYSLLDGLARSGWTLRLVTWAAYYEICSLVFAVLLVINRSYHVMVSRTLEARTGISRRNNEAS